MEYIKYVIPRYEATMGILGRREVNKTFKWRITFATLRASGNDVERKF